MALKSGKLRHKVRIEKLELMRDANGNPVQDSSTGEVRQRWREVCEVWAAIEPLSAREFIQSQAVQSQIVARITIRHQYGLDASMRIVHQPACGPRVVYNPHAFLADPESGLEYLTIPCSSGTGDGR